MGSPFKGKTPEEIEEISKRISEGVKRHYEALTPEEYSKENLNKSKATSNYWKKASKEEKEIRLKTSFLSPESLEKSIETNRKTWKSLSEEEKTERLEKGLRSPSSVKAREDYFKNLSPEEINLWTKRSFLSDKSHLNSVKNNSKLPTKEETLLENFLNRRFPTLFGYNGKGNLDVCIGGRIPDFIRLSNKLQVISVMGESFRTIGDIEEEILHYSEFGYECLIIWNGECYQETSLEEKISDFI